MMLGDDIAWALPEMRAHAESLMQDTCRITRPGEGDPVFNNTTGQYDNPPPITVYEGKCLFSPPARSSQRSAGVAAASWTLQQWTVKLPMETPGVVGSSKDVAEDQTITCMTSAHDPWLPGKKMRVAALDGGGLRKQREIAAELIVGV